MDEEIEAHRRSATYPRSQSCQDKDPKAGGLDFHHYTYSISESPG